ncbi:hypothetical protein PGT21_007142 [Puccinia graminis f. sp. tritici]|uniref:Uncharacterized protein n=1 Tax=Puccinia graminis f. sp. tritici TaxID=56615 RepID=A0A5B0NNI9_PUCGR|nr:hypothetical protein PGT21_007142 [Puccinia graminis f. sp. tritici]KAA1090116.1 hypothetical protein PGTUg99_035811 [Puccinia graminis f. sp. tritici]
MRLGSVLCLLTCCCLIGGFALAEFLVGHIHFLLHLFRSCGSRHTACTYTAVAGRWQKSPKFGRQIAGPRPPGPDRSQTGLRSAGKRTVNVPTTLPASFWANCRQNLGPIAGHGNMPSNPSQVDAHTGDLTAC